MAVPRSRQYHPPGSGGGGGGGLGAILAAMVGAPEIEGGESLQALAGPEDTQGVLTPMDKTAYSVKKPTFAQRIFNPRGVSASQGMADMLKFEDYQNQLRSGLVGQHNQGQLELEKLRSQGDIAEKAAAEQIKKDEFARSLGLPSWRHAEAILSDPDVQTSVLKKIYADNEKQGVENDFTRAKTLTQKYIPVSKDQALFNPESGFTFQNQSPLMEEPIKGGEGGLRTAMMPTDPTQRMNRGINFVKTPGGVASELAGSSFTPPDVSEFGNLNEPYIPQGSGANPTAAGTPAPAPKSAPVNTAGSFTGLGSKLGSILDPLKEIFKDYMTYGGPTYRPPKTYENPSMQPIVQPPSVLEEMKKRRQMLFPQPIQSYPFGR